MRNHNNHNNTTATLRRGTFCSHLTFAVERRKQQHKTFGLSRGEQDIAGLCDSMLSAMIVLERTLLVRQTRQRKQWADRTTDELDINRDATFLSRVGLPDGLPVARGYSSISNALSLVRSLSTYNLFERTAATGGACCLPTWI